MRFRDFNISIIPMVVLAALLAVSPSIAKENGKHEYTRSEYDKWIDVCNVSCDRSFCQWKCDSESDDRKDIACRKYKQNISKYRKCYLSYEDQLWDQCLENCPGSEDSEN